MEKPEAACLFLNGNVPDTAVLQQYCGNDRLRIAADGAYDYCLQLDFIPDVLIGDMDSIKSRPTSGTGELIHDPSISISDLEKCLRYCSKHGIADLHVFGADGKQLDHFLINIVTLAQYAAVIRIAVYTKDELLRFLPAGKYRFQTRKGQRFSLLALEPVSGLLLEGALFDVADARLQPGSQGLGNSCIGTMLGICFDSGLLLFMTRLA
ncbi:MAG: thiamine diphosphokinase [Candidatus Neomarinimicrobiota bacterium]|jgi:thiamine pyrophosphokinase|nr:thiamine diphosphokinase [Candidatus Neomarinimicrobiota bacterium]MDD3966843.1 thiamine diphosphokinase [Candidatus Neomarinimicrobiota bacterium]MDX9779848.1 thiamine diphosphokinase [bacterium]